MRLIQNPLLVLAVVAIHSVARVLGRPIVQGYYPSWKKAQMDGVDFSKYTHVNMAFAIPKEDGSFSFEGDWFLPQVVSDLHSKGVKVLMSIGGWTGSNYFSGIAKNPSTCDAFIKNVVSYIKENNLDGIDIDWEYPGRVGNKCNAIDKQNDTPNFLKLLQGLRKSMDSAYGAGKKLITLAVRVEPFDGPSGPSTDVSAFAKAVDHANLMQYDINGGWANVTGPNAPFKFEKGKGEQLSFVSAIDAWTKAGWPAKQLTAGLGFYGRSTTALGDMTTDKNNMYQRQLTNVPLGDKEDANWYDSCAGASANSGTWQWKNLRSQGVLTGPETAAPPWVRMWDEKTQTPWLFNPQTKIFISYDDPKSLQVKVNYAAEKGLAGVMIWSMNMDYNGELLKVATSFQGGGDGSGGSGNDPGKNAG
ncbi:chitinase [Martensiomyces pterosporus]|nr:chitinase [Martensiomyces pterosporus]